MAHDGLRGRRRKLRRQGPRLFRIRRPGDGPEETPAIDAIVAGPGTLIDAIVWEL
jgi:hypothetical protein